jgi:hypothetical protein
LSPPPSAAAKLTTTQHVLSEHPARTSKMPDGGWALRPAYDDCVCLWGAVGWFLNAIGTTHRCVCHHLFVGLARADAQLTGTASLTAPP